MSRIDFTPAQTTQIPTRASVPRSADSSKVSRGAAVDAAEPAGGEHADAGALGEVRRSRPRSSRRRRRGRSDRREVAHAALGDAVGRWPARSSAASSSPTRTSPPRIAIVAGTAPRGAHRRPRSPRATRRLSGRGSPWAMIVLSSATTGRPASSAVLHLVAEPASRARLGRTDQRSGPRAADDPARSRGAVTGRRGVGRPRRWSSSARIL